MPARRVLGRHVKVTAFRLPCSKPGGFLCAACGDQRAREGLHVTRPTGIETLCLSCVAEMWEETEND